jgi:hypothetical protein
MASTIIGTYPILNKQLSSIDDNGIQTLSYAFTVKTASAYDYIPSKDDEYYGPSNASASTADFFDPTQSQTRSKYLVTSVNVDNINGGLTQIVINTAGTQNINTPPKIRIIPNYPLIFGVQGIQSIGGETENPYKGYGYANKGFGIVATFVTESTPSAEGYIFSTYSNRIMPASLRNVLFPTPAKEPFSYSYNNETELTGYYSVYNGFICSETTLQRIGGVSLFQLIYSESGTYYEFVCPAGGGNCQNSVAYNFI